MYNDLKSIISSLKTLLTSDNEKRIKIVGMHQKSATIYFDKMNENSGEIVSLDDGGYLMDKKNFFD